MDSGQVATPRWTLAEIATPRWSLGGGVATPRWTLDELPRPGGLSKCWPPHALHASQRQKDDDADTPIGTTTPMPRSERQTERTLHAQHASQSGLGERERETDRRTTTPMPRSERHRCHDRDDRHSGQHCNYTTTPHITMQLERDHVITNFIHYGLIKRSHVITKHTTIMQHIGSCVMTNGYGRSAPSRPSEDSLARPSRQASAPEPTAANAARIAASGRLPFYISSAPRFPQAF